MESKLSVGLALDSYSAAAHDKRLISAGVLLCIHQKRKCKSTLVNKGDGEFLDANFQQPFCPPRSDL
jgi:hypothetical protein